MTLLSLRFYVPARAWIVIRKGAYGHKVKNRRIALSASGGLRLCFQSIQPLSSLPRFEKFLPLPCRTVIGKDFSVYHWEMPYDLAAFWLFWTVLLQASGKILCNSDFFWYSCIGREINPYVLAPEEFSIRKSENEHFISQVLLSSKLFIIGDRNDLETMVW